MLSYERQRKQGARTTTITLLSTVTSNTVKIENTTVPKSNVKSYNYCGNVVNHQERSEMMIYHETVGAVGFQLKIVVIVR